MGYVVYGFPGLLWVLRAFTFRVLRVLGLGMLRAIGDLVIINACKLCTPHDHVSHPQC